jgi:class 3 adenylate cyclase/tetratricopeptide (TPR) repeat protein
MRVCPNCGHGNPPDAEFCMSCGTALADLPAPPSQVRKIVTVLFCDVEGSTTLGDRLDPESLRQVMMRFFLEMRAVIERHGGTVGKYIGDAVMAVFGVPTLHEDDALRAVRAAEAMHASLEELNDELDRRFDVRLRTRIGINTGEVVLGDETAGESMVLGDSVNVAARLEQAAPVGGALIGAETYALVRDHIAVEPVQPLELKGKPERVHAYRLIGASRPEAPEARPETPFIGRSTELAILRSAFERVVGAQESVLMTVLGSPGIGKSRLSREFSASLPRETLVLMARSLPYGDGVTFWPITEVVKAAGGIGDDDPPAEVRVKIEDVLEGAEHAQLIADRLGALLGLEAGTAELQETFWAIRKFLESLGRDRPVVLVLDDLQWAEPTFLDLIEYLAGWTKDTAMLVLCLARPDLLDVRPTWGRGTTPSDWLSLSALDDEESRRLIGELLGGAQVDETEVRGIAESAGGNALFLEEILRMLEDDGVLRGEEGRWTVAGDLSAVAVPASIQALLGARLDRLADEERTVIRAASVVGQVFWWGAVAELVPDGIHPHVGSHLQTLVRKDLIRPDGSTFPKEDGFRFHHVLVQEAAYRSAPKGLRAELHERVAGWLSGKAGDRVAEFEEVIGHHLERAFGYRSELGVGEEGLRSLGLRGGRALGSAGQRALARRDVSAAVNLCSRAADLLPSDAGERRSILLALGEALGETGDSAQAERWLDEAERLAEEAGQAAMAANAAILRLSLLKFTDPKRLSDEGEGVAEHLITTLEELEDHVGLARAWRLVADLRWARSRYGGADQALARAISHAREAGDAREEADGLGRYVGSGTYGPAHVQEIERRCRELLSFSGGMARWEAPALRALATVRGMEGRFDEARGLAERARASFEEFGFRLAASWVWETSGTIELLAGDSAAAERAFRTGFDAAAELGDQGFQVTVAALLALAEIEQGHVEEADRWTALSERSAAADDMASQVLWRSARARILAASGAADEGESFAREAVELAEQTDDINMHADTLVNLGIVLTEAGRPKEAAEALDQAAELYERKGNRVALEASRRRREALPLP